MLIKKTIAAVALSSMMAVAMGTLAANQFVFADKYVKINTPLNQIDILQGDASLLVEQITGSNEAKLALVISDEYTNNITSLDLSVKFDSSIIKNVAMMEGSTLSAEHYKSTYDATTGRYRILLVGSKDLIENQKIELGKIKFTGEKKTQVSTSIQLEKLETVDLLHNKDILTVDHKEHSLEYIPSSTPEDVPGDTPEDTPEDKPEDVPGDTPEDKPEDTPEDRPSDTPEDDSGNAPEDKPSDTPSDMPNQTPGTPNEPEKPSVPSEIKVTSVQLNQSTSTLKVGEKVQLIAQVLPSNASNPNLKWTSSNTSVVTVSRNGKVTAVKKGTATITAMSTDGSKVEAKAVIKVKNVKVKSIKLSNTSVTLLPKEDITLKATVAPSNATNKKLIWTSSNKKVATVTKNGIVKAKATGTTIITVTTQDGSKVLATCKIKVSTLKLNISNASIKVGKTLPLVAQVYGENQVVSFSSSNTKVATVTKKGKIKGKAKGTAIITVKAKGVTSKVKITVK